MASSRLSLSASAPWSFLFLVGAENMQISYRIFKGLGKLIPMRSLLIATCAVPFTASSPEDTLHHRRDEAIIRLMFETAIRSGEVTSLQLDDLDLISRLITIRRGKGARGRVIPIGQATTEALLIYLDEREKHPLAHTPDLC